MKTELSPSAKRLLTRIAIGPWLLSQFDSGGKELVRLGLIHRPASGWARITEVGQELLAKMKGAK